MLFNECVKRNLKGIEFEKKGRIEEAITLYEENIKDNFDGNHPYDRLAVIYHKMHKFEDEIRVLKHAIYVFESIVNPQRADRLQKLDKFKVKLNKAEK
jgi:hypothetical protein